MSSMERRPDGAFEVWLRGVSTPALRWMEQQSIHAGQAWHASPAAYADEGTVEETAARWLVREHLREVWEARRRARREEEAVLGAALTGTLEAPAALREPTQRLARAVRDRDLPTLPLCIREVCEPLVPGYCWDRPAGAPTWHGDGIEPTGPARIVFLAGRVLREGGALEETHAAFHWSQRVWHWWWCSERSTGGAERRGPCCETSTTPARERQPRPSSSSAHQSAGSISTASKGSKRRAPCSATVTCSQWPSWRR